MATSATYPDEVVCFWVELRGQGAHVHDLVRSGHLMAEKEKNRKQTPRELWYETMRGESKSRWRAVQVMRVCC